MCLFIESLKLSVFFLELGLSANAVVAIVGSSLCLDQRKAASHVIDYLPTSKGSILFHM